MVPSEGPQGVGSADLVHRARRQLLARAGRLRLRPADVRSAASSSTGTRSRTSRRTLAVWGTSGDDLWEVQLDVATGPPRSTSSTAASGTRCNSTTRRQAATCHIAAGGDCKDFDAGTEIDGNFIADDLFFGSWSLSTEPEHGNHPVEPAAADPALPSTTAAPRTRWPRLEGADGAATGGARDDEAVRLRHPHRRVRPVDHQQPSGLPATPATPR